MPIYSPAGRSKFLEASELFHGTRSSNLSRLPLIRRYRQYVRPIVSSLSHWLNRVVSFHARFQRQQVDQATGEVLHVDGGATIRSIGHISRLQRSKDNDSDYVDPMDMLSELPEDNEALITRMREAHDLCDEAGDVATTSLLEVWIDEAERRVWFLFEATRARDYSAVTASGRG